MVSFCALYTICNIFNVLRYDDSAVLHMIRWILLFLWRTGIIRVEIIRIMLCFRALLQTIWTEPASSCLMIILGPQWVLSIYDISCNIFGSSLKWKCGVKMLHVSVNQYQTCTDGNVVQNVNNNLFLILWKYSVQKFTMTLICFVMICYWKTNSTNIIIIVFFVSSASKWLLITRLSWWRWLIVSLTL